MAWIKVEASVSRNPKFLKAGPAASWLWLCGLGYCQEGLTDGFIPFEAIDFLGVKHAGRLAPYLVTAGLWELADGGWRVHDYLVHNKQASDVHRIQDARRAAGVDGGKRSGEARREANAKQCAEANAKHAANPSTSTATATATQTATATATSHSITARRRLHAAWEGEKGLYVPQGKHTDFVAIRNHSEAERELFAWYEAVASAWVGSPGADMLKFWTARFDEKWPTAAVAAPSRRPHWAPQPAAVTKVGA